MTFLPLKSVVAAFQTSLSGSSDASCGFAIADLKVELPAEISVVGGEVLVKLASSADPVDPAILTRLTLTLGATCTPETAPQGTSPWTVVASGTQQSLHAACSDATATWIVGMGGKVLSSTDGAVTFAPVDVGTTGSLLAVVKVGDVVVAAGELGMAWVREPASGQWFPANVSSPEHLHGLASRGAQIVAVGASGTVQVSGDQGQSFSLLPQIVADDLNSVVAGADGLVWAAGASGTVLLSKDLKGWQQMPAVAGQHWYSLSIGGAGLVYMAGESGVLATYSTGVGGKLLSSGTTKHLYAIHALQAGGVLAVGADGTAVWSKNGTSFTPLSPPTTESLHAISSLGNGKLLVVGSGGTLLRLDTTML